MAKVTCRCCGEKIDKKIAIGIPKGKTTWYYCPEHVGQKSPKEKMYDLIYEIFGRKVLHTMLYKEMDEILNAYDVNIVISYLEENKSDIAMAMRRSFVHEFAEIRFFSAIVKNHIGSFKSRQPEPIIKKEIEVDFDMSANKYKAKKQRKGMDSLLDDLL